MSRAGRADGLADALARLSADNEAMRIGATAAMSELLRRPAQPGDVGRGHEVAFGAALLALSYAIERGALAVKVDKCCGGIDDLCVSNGCLLGFDGGERA